jgi:hypothetical protein
VLREGAAAAPLPDLARHAGHAETAARIHQLPSVRPGDLTHSGGLGGEGTGRGSVAAVVLGALARHPGRPPVLVAAAWPVDALTKDLGEGAVMDALGGHVLGVDAEGDGVGRGQLVGRRRHHGAT